MNFLYSTSNRRSLEKTAQGKAAKVHFSGNKPKTQSYQPVPGTHFSTKSGRSKRPGRVRAHPHTPGSPMTSLLLPSMELPRGIQLLQLEAPAIPEGRNLSDTWHSLFQQTTAKSFPKPGPHHFEDQEAESFLGQR